MITFHLFAQHASSWLIVNMALITWHGTVSFEKQSQISEAVGLLYRYVCYDTDAKYFLTRLRPLHALRSLPADSAAWRL